MNDFRDGLIAGALGALIGVAIVLSAVWWWTR